MPSHQHTTDVWTSESITKKKCKYCRGKGVFKDTLRESCVVVHVCYDCHTKLIAEDKVYLSCLSK